MSLMGKAVVLIWNDVTQEGREGFYAWHDKEHIPERLSLDGFLRGRRYRGNDASPEWLTVYEARDMSVLTGEAYLERLNHPTPLTQASVKDFRNTARSICSIESTQGDSTGAYVLTMQMRMEKSFPSFDALLARGDVLAMHRFIADESASNVQTEEAKARAFTVPSHIVVIEAATQQGIDICRETLDAFDWASHGIAAERCNVYTLEITRLSKSLHF
jgi:hypothetical protein